VCYRTYESRLGEYSHPTVLDGQLQQDGLTSYGDGRVTVLALIAFNICFAFSLAPVTWTIINERFLSLVGWIGSSSTFWLFALLCAIGWIWIYYRVPKTKGQTLEQIQEMWKEKP